MFDRYHSNVSAGTGNNYMLTFESDEIVSVRAFFKVNIPGEFHYRFFFQNTVNSTFDHGEIAYPNRSGGRWIIRSASVGTAEIASATAPIHTQKAVTFDGDTTKTVTPDEAFWSDELLLCIPENQYLVWEWVIEGNEIPCTPDSQAPTFVTCASPIPWDNCPLPSFIGCDRPVKKRLAFVGDSITQGCGTRLDRYEMWVSRIADLLKEDYSVWNLGLGYSRASDAATLGSIFYKMTQNDLVVLTYGVNDLLHGGYRAQRPESAEAILSYLETIVSALRARNIDVILSTVPPFDYSESSLAEWRKLNLALPSLAQKYDCRIFDIEAVLDAAPTPLGNDYTRYGAHPDGNGGLAVAEAFRNTFFQNGTWQL